MHVLPCIRDLQNFQSRECAFLLLFPSNNLVCCAHLNSIFFYSLKCVLHSRKDCLWTLLAIRLAILLSNDANKLKRSKSSFILIQEHRMSKQFLHNHLYINMRHLSQRLFDQFLFNKLPAATYLLQILPIYLQDLYSRLLDHLSVSCVPIKQSLIIYTIQLNTQRARNLLQ